MHIPDHMLNGTICPVTAAVSVAGVGAAVYLARKAKEKPSAASFAMVSALVFAAQMLNFPIRHGTSGHLLGGVLIASVIGVPFAVLAMALILTIQCLVFSDGGLTVLGANVLNMALIGAGLGGWLCRRWLDSAEAGSGRRWPILLVSSWLSVMAAALACSLELALSGAAQLGEALPAMLGAHAWIGLGEAALTAAIFLALAGKIELNPQPKTWLAALGAFAAAALMSPFASSFPDGLEWVAEKYRFLHDQAPVFVSPLPDYSVSFVSNPALSTSLAGLIGVIVTAVAALSLAAFLSLGISRKRIGGAV